LASLLAIGRQRLQGLAVTLAWVLLATGSNTTLQAHALATAAGRQGEAGQWLGSGSSFAVCFSKDFVAHVAILLRLVRKPIFSHFFGPLSAPV
jgi:hypothetical protein